MNTKIGTNFILLDFHFLFGKPKMNICFKYVKPDKRKKKPADNDVGALLLLIELLLNF